MSATLTTDVLQDDVAVLLARVMAVANKRATELGVNVRDCLISITQGTHDAPDWRVSYGPKDYIGHRGGDLIVEVDPADVSVTRVLRGQ